jgi:hypothetical protein
MLLFILKVPETKCKDFIGKSVNECIESSNKYKGKDIDGYFFRLRVLQNRVI